MNKIAKWILCLLMSTVLCSQVMAQTTEPILPGSTSKMDKAVLRADIIVVGKLEKLGITNPDALGEASYDKAHITVTKPLKGTSASNLAVTICVQYTKGKIEEKTPEEGKEYLFFIHTDEAKRLIVVKMLPATASNVSAVSAVIAK